MLLECLEVLLRVAEYTEHVKAVQRVCDHHEWIISWQKETNKLNAQQLLPGECNNSDIPWGSQLLKYNLA